jgi:hypothetical protein
MISAWRNDNATPDLERLSQHGRNLFDRSDAISVPAVMICVEQYFYLSSSIEYSRVTPWITLDDRFFTKLRLLLLQCLKN